MLAIRYTANKLCSVERLVEEKGDGGESLWKTMNRERCHKRVIDDGLQSHP